MKKMSMYKMDNQAAVSPIVATLVLIVVAVVGAVAVGTIMGTFSTDVSKKTNAGDASGASSNEILIAGSTTVQPASELIAKTYMLAHPGMKITVQGGGSGAGVTSAGQGIVDIGASSDLTKITDAQSTHPEWDLRYYTIGGSGVVVIANSGFSGTVINKTQLHNAYASTQDYTIVGNSTVTPTSTVQRSDSSGTEETFAKYIDYTAGNVDNAGNSVGVNGNQAVVDKVKTTTGSIGFTDMGYAFDASGVAVTGIKVLSIDDGGVTYTTTKDNIKDAAKIKAANPTGTSTKYPVGLARGLYLMTKGEPNSVVKNYITFCQSPGAQADINKAGMFANADLS
jgi:phosphate transport system substrate-binding protein